jgi:hypothetical protein
MNTIFKSSAVSRLRKEKSAFESSPDCGLTEGRLWAEKASYPTLRALGKWWAKPRRVPISHGPNSQGSLAHEAVAAMNPHANPQNIEVILSEMFPMSPAQGLTNAFIEDWIRGAVGVLAEVDAAE